MGLLNNIKLLQIQYGYIFTNPNSYLVVVQFPWDDSFERKTIERYEKQLRKSRNLPKSTQEAIKSTDNQKPSTIKQAITTEEKTLTRATEKLAANSTFSIPTTSSKPNTDESNLPAPNTIETKSTIDTNNDKTIYLKGQEQQIKSVSDALASITISSPSAVSTTLDQTISNANSLLDDVEERMIGKTPEEIARLYLPDETVERQAIYSEMFRLTRTLSPAPTSAEVLRAYFAYEGNVDKGVAALGSFVALKELGFPVVNIWLALLMYNNNQEEALEYLIRGGNDY